MTLACFARPHSIPSFRFTTNHIPGLHSMNTLTFTKIAGQLNRANSEFPRIITKPEELHGLNQVCTWLTANKPALEAALSDAGALLFRGFPITDADSFDAFSAAFEYPSFTYQCLTIEVTVLMSKYVNA